MSVTLFLLMMKSYLLVLETILLLPCSNFYVNIVIDQNYGIFVLEF